jgi:energy-coupling factor transporter transmembrane protein EcfT
MKYLNLIGFIVCIVVVFLPEEFRLLLLIPAIIFIINGTMLIIKGRKN